jgi:hypothetical protein
MVEALSIHIQVDFCLERQPQLQLLLLELHRAVVQNLVLRHQPYRRHGLEDAGLQVDDLTTLLVNPRRPFQKESRSLPHTFASILCFSGEAN